MNKSESGNTGKIDLSTISAIVASTVIIPSASLGRRRPILGNEKPAARDAGVVIIRETVAVVISCEQSYTCRIKPQTALGSVGNMF